jgi:hypothetical protein
MGFGRRHLLDYLEMTEAIQKRITDLKRLIAARKVNASYADSVRKAQEEIDRLEKALKL